VKSLSKITPIDKYLNIRVLCEHPILKMKTGTIWVKTKRQGNALSLQYIPITDFRFPTTDYRLPITGYRLPVAF
jgi:hypothetical protein